MELTIKGQNGADANLATSVDPDFASTIVLGEGKTAKIIEPSASFAKIGSFPLKTKIFFMFNMRPWKFSVQQENGAMFSTTSEEQGLKTTIIISPDIASITLNFEA